MGANATSTSPLTSILTFSLLKTDIMSVTTVFSKLLPGSDTTTSKVAKVALIYGSTWVLWKLLRRAVSKKKTSSLDSVAGPNGGSLLAGKHILYLKRLYTD